MINRISPISHDLPKLTPERKKIIQEQVITSESPGIILRDFQTILKFLQPDGVELSSTNHLFSLKYLQELNDSLSYPTQTKLKRPQQKSYPYIHGLYFVLRTSGLSQVITKGKKARLYLDTNLIKIWQGFNPTEQYFTLLESWLLWGNSEVLGEHRDPYVPLYRCLQFWREIPDQGLTFSSYREQEELIYYPSLYNVALLHLFGLIELGLGEAEPGKGWRLTSLKRLPWGDAIIGLLSEIYHDIQPGTDEEIIIDFRSAFAKLKPYLKPYFPEWQQTLVIFEGLFAQAIYIFKVSLMNAWRRIAVSSTLNFDQLVVAVVQTCNFDHEHLYRFIYKDRLNRSFEFSHPFVGIPPQTSDYCLGELPLEVGNHLLLIFDLSNEWEFDLYLEQILPEDDNIEQFRLLESHGEPPSQYGDN